MRRFGFGLIALLLWPDAGAAARAAPNWVTFEHGGCESRCAVYGLTVTGDGRAIYRGRFYVRKTGEVVARLRPAEVLPIFEKLAALDLGQLKPVYRRDAGDCEDWAEDRPTSTLTISMGGVSKVVVYNLGCIGPLTSRLADIEHAMNRAARIERLIK